MLHTEAQDPEAGFRAGRGCGRPPPVRSQVQRSQMRGSTSQQEMRGHTQQPPAFVGEQIPEQMCLNSAWQIIIIKY